MSKSMLLKPRISEKAYGLSQTAQVYVFQVPSSANKLTVKQAVADQFGVTVLSVNVANSKGKQKRSIRRGGRPTIGRRSDFKKAYVTIKEGETIPVFAAEEDNKKETQKSQTARTTRIKKGAK